MARDLQDMYSISILMHFVFTGGVLCMTAFVVANMVGGVVRVFLCGLFVFGLIVELMITCILGNLILYESDTLEAMIEGTHVYTMHSKIYKKWLRIILTKANVPTRLVAVSVFPLDIETFKSLMVTTYSFFTLLKTLKP
ncbi:unnamed protein product [Nezara viridula]|uniref:Odorant receptor n=1 Tax=Nezara viridula TaxID=85310 RepID=A0A9P0EDJ8_NEZVI|nr:unnamed protein product [Nezara viridula]